MKSSNRDLTEYDDSFDRTPQPKGRSGRFVKPKFFFYGFIFGIIALSSVALALYLQGAFEPEPEPEPEPQIINETYVNECLMPAAELTSAKYIYSGIMDYDNKKLPIIKKSKFSMFYTATVRIGIEDLSDSVIEVTDDTITVILPASTITEVTIQPSKLRFFDEKYPLMADHSHDEVAEALKAVEDDVRKTDMTECLNVADENAANIVRDFLTKADGLNDRELIIQRGPRKSTTAETAHIDSETY